MKGHYSLYTDGASRGNPGHAGAGVVIIDPKGKVICKRAVYLGKKTNNEAEYLALILGLNEVCRRCLKEICIFLDSNLIVNQIKGVFSVKAPNLIPLHLKVRQLLRKVPKYDIFYIRREKNRLADRLANLGIDRELK